MSIDFDIEDIIEKVQESGVLGKSERQYDLLIYLLEHTKSETSNTLKAYTIAVEVFGRPTDFDDRIDSIVRVEMHRLRKALKAFNLSGQAFTLKIMRASYEVEVSRNQDADAKGKFNILPKFISRRFILSTSFLIFLGGVLAYTFMFRAGGVAENCSSYYPNVRVVHSGKSTASDADVEKYQVIISSAVQQSLSMNFIGPKNTCPGGDAVYSLVTNFDESPQSDTIQMQILLYSDYSDESLNFGVERLDKTSEFFIEHIVRFVHNFTSPKGIILRHAAQETAHSALLRDNLSCIVGLYDYWGGSDKRPEYEQVYRCMEKLIDEDRASGAQYAFFGRSILGLANRPKHVPFYKNVKYPAEWTKEYGTEIMRRGLEKFPDDKNMLRFLFVYYISQDPPDIDRLKQYRFLYRKSFPLNPDFEYSMTRLELYFSGDLDKALEMVRRVREMSYSEDNSLRVLEVMYALNKGLTEEDYNLCVDNFERSAVEFFAILYYLCAVEWGDEEHKIQAKQNLSNFHVFTKSDLEEAMHREIYISQFLIDLMMDIVGEDMQDAVEQ